MDQDNAKKRFGQRIQRCYGCFSAFYLKDMWLAEEGTFYCRDCKNDSMFHFDDYIGKLDATQLPGISSDGEETTQCQNPFTRQQ